MQLHDQSPLTNIPAVHGSRTRQSHKNSQHEIHKTALTACNMHKTEGRSCTAAGRSHAAVLHKVVSDSKGCMGGCGQPEKPQAALACR